MYLLVEIRKTDPSAPCGKDSTFAIMSEKLFKSKPSYGAAKLVMSIYRKQGNTQKVEELMNQLPTFAKTSAEKAEAYYKLAQAKRQAGNKTAARTFALKAAATDAKFAAKAYNLIGDLYYNSWQLCNNKNPVLRRVIYIAAYEMYQRAGNSTMMAKAKRQFPDITVAHTYGMERGQMVSVGCWIGGKVKLMLR
jgi:tetratricopeptide (TPR) repeat protein